MSVMNFSATAQRALDETWSALIEGAGNGDARLEFFTGEMPESPDNDVTTQRMLARLYIMPHTMRVEPGHAIASGDVGWARLVGANGRAVADFLVSLKNGPAMMTFNTLGIRKGGPVSYAGRMALFWPQPPSDE